jgi:hypothetical protein
MSVPRYFVAGLALLAMVALQQGSGWRWGPLAAWQGDDLYKQLSGFALAVFIAHQWYVPLLRLGDEVQRAARRLGLHKGVGAFAPLLYFMHAQQPGAGYLLGLSLVLLGSLVTGLFNPETVRPQPPWFRSAWTPLHVGFSTVLPSLAAYHVWVTYLYE